MVYSMARISRQEVITPRTLATELDRELVAAAGQGNRPQPAVVEIPQLVKTVQCGKCGEEIRVGKNVVLAYCRECSAGLGVKR
jgi:hypothetical protein